MRILRTLVSLIACLVLGAPAIAATLGSVQGQVMVNRGNGYQSVQGTVELNPGDVVVVNPGGSAQLSYADGCSVQVAVGSVVTVAEQSPCVTQTTGPQGFAPPGGLGIFLLSTGVAAGAVVYLLSTNDKDKPASP
jgi:hypothetical protein